MNILFLNTYKPTNNTSGGIARVTCNLGNLFTTNGYHCGVAYYYDSKGEVCDCFKDALQLSFYQEKPELERMTVSYNIIIIQVQMSKDYLHLVPLFYDIRKKYGTKIIYCHHNVPFTETAGYDFQFFKFLLFNSSAPLSGRLKESFWCLFSILMPRWSTRRIALRRQYVTDNVDKTVLLSDSFIPSFRQYVKCPDNKVVAIGNCITFRETLKPEELDLKDKTVLIVSNMYERAKRISTMLIIWKMVTQNKSSEGWKLILVGDGPDIDYYRKLAKRLKLTDVSFEGTQDPLPYYKKGGLLMLASAYEGFGMVILEAQQMGCVPVVYDSYESVHDLITDGENGLLVENKNKKEFADKLILLMENADLRRKIALNCIDMDNRFSNDVIFAKWKKLFESIEN